MTAAPLESNPFALMMNPEAVLAAIAGSERLAQLGSRICRPLDKPPVKSGAVVPGEASMEDHLGRSTNEPLNRTAARDGRNESHAWPGGIAF